MTDPVRTAVVTGASRGFGSATAAALVGAGRRVVGIARDAQRLRAVRDDLGAGFVPVAADLTDDTLAERVIREHRPDLLVLNAGAAPHMAALHEQTWETFGRCWEVDTRHVFTWTRAALRVPLTPGGVVVAFSSGAALGGGSPRSGGFGAAKAGIRFVARYAREEAAQAGLGLRFVTLLPGLTPNGIGALGVADYAARQGVDRETFVARLQPVLTPEQVAKAVLELAADPDTAAEYELNGAGLHPID